MSYNIYNVSQENRVISFSQNQLPPNKVGRMLGDILLEAVKSGTPYSAIKQEIERVHAQMVAENIRGIASVNLSCREYKDRGCQDANIIYLSYKLNGTFVTFTEYLPIHSTV